MNYVLIKHSMRFWTYRVPNGWIFDDLTDEERNRMQNSPYMYGPIKRGGKLVEDGTIRLPLEPSGRFLYANSTRDLCIWFAACTITNLHPLMLAYLRLVRVENYRKEDITALFNTLFDEGEMRTDTIIEYPLQAGIYLGYLWNDEVDLCRSLGCQVTVYDGWGWNQPFTAPPVVKRTLPEYSFVYALVDPFSNEVRYVGKADSPEKRFRDHLIDTHNKVKYAWIEQIHAQGASPKMLILEKVKECLALERELWWIQHYEKLGCQLTNYTSQYRLRKKEEVLWIQTQFLVGAIVRSREKPGQWLQLDAVTVAPDGRRAIGSFIHVRRDGTHYGRYIGNLDAHTYEVVPFEDLCRKSKGKLRAHLLRPTM